MSFKLVIFDLDGTLVDSIHGLALAMNTVLEKHNLPIHSTNQYKYFVGNGMRELARKALPPELANNTDLVTECYNAMSIEYSQCWEYQMTVYDGMYTLLDTLTAMKIKIGINTNKKTNFTETLISKYFSRYAFCAVIGDSSVNNIKPNPEGALYIARTAGVNPEECIYCGDSDIDVQTATNAGMFHVGALWGFRSKSDLLNAGAKHLINHPMELLDYLQL